MLETLKKDPEIWELNTFVVVEQLVSPPNDPSAALSLLGGQDGTWVRCCDMYAKVVWNKGRDEVNGKRVQAYNWAQLIGRWDPRMDETMRVVWSNGGKTITGKIRAINNIEERNKYMILTVETGVGQ